MITPSGSARRGAVKVDLCVIGAGFAGLAAAEAALARGATVALIEATHRAGGRARTVHPRVSGRRIPVEAGPEFVDEAHALLRDACQRAGVALLPVRGGLSTFVGGALVTGAPAPTAAEQRYEDAYRTLVDEITTGIDQVAHPERHVDALRHDSRSVADLFDEAEAQVGPAPLARRHLDRFSQGMLGAESANVSALFMAQQALLDGGGGSARVAEGLGSVAGWMLAGLSPRASVHLGLPVTNISWSDERARVSMGDMTITADGVVLAVPLGSLLAIHCEPALPEAWLAAARSLHYGSLTKTSLYAPDLEIPGWAVMSDLPSGLVWQARPGVVTTYAGGARAEALVDWSYVDVLEQAADDVSRIAARKLAPDGITWRWSPRSRRGGCYVVYGPGQITAHWADLRRTVGPFALAGEHCGTFCGYVEGAMESGAAAANTLLTRTPG
jgi:monoamine oxidase